MEIKQGDTVRVSKDTPKMYLRGFDHIFTGVESVVSEVEDDNAVIIFNTDHINSQTTIPTKYLIKVDAEAKEAKYKVGDKVRVKGSVLLEGGVFSIIGADYNEKFGWRYELNIHEWYPEIDLDLYTKPAEQTEAEIDVNEELQEIFTPFSLADRIERNHILHRMRVFSQDDFVKEINPAEHEVITKPHYVPKIMFNTEFWVKYEADLAKELAISYAKRGKNPLDAVAAAKEIVKRLKQK